MVWETLILEVFGDQGLFWNALCEEVEEEWEESFPREASGGGVERVCGWVGRTPKMGSTGVGRCVGKGKMEAVGSGSGVARHSGIDFALAV